MIKLQNNFISGLNTFLAPHDCLAVHQRGWHADKRMHSGDCMRLCGYSHADMSSALHAGGLTSVPLLLILALSFSRLLARGESSPGLLSLDVFAFKARGLGLRCL